MNRRLAAFGSLAVAAIIAVSACSYQKEFESGPSDYGSRTERHEQPGSTPFAIQSTSADHDNASLQLRQPISEAVDNLKGIRGSFVFVTDKNAYVALILDRTATGLKGKGDHLTSTREITSPGVDDRSNVMNRWPNGSVLYGDIGFDTIPNPHDLSSELVEAVTDAVREQLPAIGGIFVSANMEFTNRLSELAHMQWRGESLQPELTRFNAMVKRHFGETAPSRPIVEGAR